MADQDNAAREALHAAMIATALDAIIVCDEIGTIEEFNPAAETLYGITRAEVIGTNIGDFPMPEALRTLPTASARFRRIVDPSVVGRRVTRRWVRRDGSIFPMEIAITRIELPGHVRWMAHCRDLSHEHAQRDALQRAGSVHEAMIAGAIDSIILADAVGTVIEFNPAAEAMFLHTRSEVLGRNIADFLVVPKLRELEPTTEGRFRRMIDERVVGRRLLRRAVRSNGEEFPLEIAVTRSTIGDDHVWMAHCRDLTNENRQKAELAEAEAARRDVERVGAEILRTVLDAFVLADEEGRIIDFNPAAEAMLGHRREAAVGRLLSETIIPPIHRKAHDDGMKRYMATGVSRVMGQRMQLEALAANGDTIPVEVTINEVRVRERRLFTAHMRDLRESRRAQAEIEAQRSRIHQIEKLSAMGSLLAGVAHELNNPLAILVAQSTLLKEKAETDDVRKRAERIHAAAERSGRIVKSFLALARESAPTRETVRLDVLVQETLEMLAYGLRTSGIEVERAFEAAMPPSSIDPDMIRQVIANLVLNAQQALVGIEPPRRIAVRIAGAGDHVVMEIEDNGPGVAADVAPRVFDPFFTTKPVGVGTGIGLTICKDIVQAHEGTLELIQRPGRGALFRVTLPHGHATHERLEPGGSPRVSSDRILVVDDEIDVGQSLADVLDMLGHSALVLTSAHEGLERAAREPFDRVFVDLRMPEMSGLAFIDRLREVAPGLAARAVLVTGDTVRGPALLLGGRTDVYLLEKPFTIESVRSAIEAAD
jgi:PAS domain S-box-containing protein